MLNPQVLLSLYVCAEPGLNLSCGVFAAEHAVPAISHLRDEALDVGLDHDEALALASELLAHRVAAPRTLDVNNEELLGVGENHVRVPTLVGVHAKQILYYHLQTWVPCQPRPVHVGCEKVVTELLLICHVERVLARHHLVHRYAHRPHVRCCRIPLKPKNFGCPVNQSVWHSVLYKDFGEKLVGVSCRIKLDLS